MNPRESKLELFLWIRTRKYGAERTWYIGFRKQQKEQFSQLELYCYSAVVNYPPDARRKSRRTFCLTAVKPTEVRKSRQGNDPTSSRHLLLAEPSSSKFFTTLSPL
mmetsp:Transcript_22171/g.89737  ORF Transcript_22171/g.89737 Transcript_22171/m.89737 type:complete len:106 (-) Transcript_22171:186-503(-)